MLTPSNDHAMGISENFLVNTKSFDPIIKALISRSEHPEKITDTLLEEMGYDNPSDLLVIHVLRGLDIINQDRTPSELYFKMVDPKQTKDAIAEGVINGYRELFEQNYDVHKMLPGELLDELIDYFDGKKTDLIVKYIANTFHKLITFAGFRNVELARDKYFKKETTKAGNDAEADTYDAGTKGSSLPFIEGVLNQGQTSGRKSVEEVLFDKKETKSEAEDEKEPEIEQASKETELEDTVVEEDTEDQDDIEDAKEADEDSASDTPSDSVVSPDDDISLPDLNTSNKRVQKAVIKRAELQYKLEYYEKALKSTEELIAYFDDADEELLQKAVSDAVIRRVDILKKLGKNHKLLTALNEVISRFGNSDSKRYYDHASEAMLEKAGILNNKDFDSKDLLPLYNAIIKRLRHETEPATKEKVDDIFVRRLALLIQSDDRAELLGVLEDSIKRFKQVGHLRMYLEEAMFRKAELLEEMSRNEDALEAYISFLKEFE